MKVSVARLVHKRDDKRNSKNWRPISLLNSDYKIGCETFSLRLAKILDAIIDSDQSYSVPNRSIFRIWPWCEIKLYRAIGGEWDLSIS